MDLPKGAERAVAAAVALNAAILAAARHQPMLTVEKRGAGETHAHRRVQGAACLDPAPADQPLEIGACDRIDPVQGRRGDLRHQAGIVRALLPLGHLDVPVTVVLGPLDAAHPTRQDVDLALAPGAQGAAVVSRDWWWLPSREHLHH